MLIYPPFKYIYLLFSTSNDKKNLSVLFIMNSKVLLHPYDLELCVYEFQEKLPLLVLIDAFLIFRLLLYHKNLLYLNYYFHLHMLIRSYI